MQTHHLIRVQNQLVGLNGSDTLNTTCLSHLRVDKLVYCGLSYGRGPRDVVYST